MLLVPADFLNEIEEFDRIWIGDICGPSRESFHPAFTLFSRPILITERRQLPAASACHIIIPPLQKYLKKESSVPSYSLNTSDVPAHTDSSLSVYTDKKAIFSSNTNPLHRSREYSKYAKNPWA